MNFSVLIALYEKEKPEFWRACLQSLADQKLPANEIIVVYDGPIPETLHQVTQSFAHLPIKIHQLPHNMGLARALNRGWKQCAYEWIFRMDSDDIAAPQRFEKQCYFIQNHPQIGLLGGQIAEFEHTINDIQQSRFVPTQHSDIVEFSKRRNPFNHMTIAYRKTNLALLGGYHDHPYMEDYNLWLRMLHNGVQSANLDEVLVYARIGAGMIQRRHGWRYVKSEWQLFLLKKQLNNHLFSHFGIFMGRAILRLLPIALLKKFYTLIRQ